MSEINGDVYGISGNQHRVEESWFGDRDFGDRNKADVGYLQVGFGVFPGVCDESCRTGRWDRRLVRSDR